MPLVAEHRGYARVDLRTEKGGTYPPALFFLSMKYAPQIVTTPTVEGASPEKRSRMPPTTKAVHSTLFRTGGSLWLKKP